MDTRCPSCKNIFSIGWGFLGEEVICPDCQKVFVAKEYSEQSNKSVSVLNQTAKKNNAFIPVLWIVLSVIIVCSIVWGISALNTPSLKDSLLIVFFIAIALSMILGVALFIKIMLFYPAPSPPPQEGGMATFKCSHCGTVCSYETLKSGAASDMKQQNMGCACLFFVAGMFCLFWFWPVGLILIFGAIVFACNSGNLRFNCPVCGKANNVSANRK